MNQFDEAIDLKRRVLSIRKHVDGPATLSVFKAANDIDVFRVGKLIYPEYGKQLSKALPLTLSQISAAEATLGSDHANAARGRFNLARVYGASNVGVLGAAVELHDRVLRQYTKMRGADHWEALEVTAALARLYVGARQYKKAEPLFESMREIADKTLGPNDPAAIQLLSERAYALRDSGQYDKAAKLFEQVLVYWEQVLARSDERHPIVEVRHALEPLGDTYHLMGSVCKGRALYARLLDSKDQLIAMPTPVMARIMRKLGDYATVAC